MTELATLPPRETFRGRDEMFFPSDRLNKQTQRYHSCLPWLIPILTAYNETYRAEPEPMPFTPTPEKTMPELNPKNPLCLDQFLKLTGIAGTGGQAKILIQGGEISVNGELETRRRRKLSAGDVVEFDGNTYSPDEFL